MTLNWWNVALLGIVQGVTELLPISSDGHLAVVEKLLGLNNVPLTFDIMLHGGTFFSIVWFFRKDLLALDRAGWTRVAIATVPVVAFGFLARESIEVLKYSSLIVGVGFLCSAVLLFISHMLLRANDAFLERYPWLLAVQSIVRHLPAQWRSTLERQPDWVQALCVGLLQTLAILPGVTRSGSALAGGLLVGFDKDTAFRFAFLVGVPAIGGAVLYDMLRVWQSGDWSQHPWGLYLWGAVIAGVTGLIALRVLQFVMQRSLLLWFVGYLTIVGIVTVLFV